MSFMIWLLHCTTRLVEGGGLVSNPYDVPVWVKTAYMGIYQLFCVGEGCGVVSGSDGMPLLLNCRIVLIVFTVLGGFETLLEFLLLFYVCCAGFRTSHARSHRGLWVAVSWLQIPSLLGISGWLIVAVVGVFATGQAGNPAVDAVLIATTVLLVIFGFVASIASCAQTSRGRTSRLRRHHHHRHASYQYSASPQTPVVTLPPPPAYYAQGPPLYQQPGGSSLPPPPAYHNADASAPPLQHVSPQYCHHCGAAAIGSEVCAKCGQRVVIK